MEAGDATTLLVSLLIIQGGLAAVMLVGGSVRMWLGLTGVFDDVAPGGWWLLAGTALVAPLALTVPEAVRDGAATMEDVLRWSVLTTAGLAVAAVAWTLSRRPAT